VNAKTRKESGVIWLPLTFLTAFLLLAEISPSKFAYYLPHTTVIMAAALGVFCSYQPRKLALLAIAALGGIQLAGAARVVHQDEYRRVFLPAARAAAQISAPHSVVVASNEFWFGLEPEREVLNDHFLGMLSGIRPSIFVMDQTYRELHERDRREDPAAYQYVQTVLDQSREVFDGGYYHVYLRTPAGPE
jgi:hypothetical protein